MEVLYPLGQQTKTAIRLQHWIIESKFLVGIHPPYCFQSPCVFRPEHEGEQRRREEATLGYWDAAFRLSSVTASDEWLLRKGEKPRYLWQWNGKRPQRPCCVCRMYGYGVNSIFGHSSLSHPEHLGDATPQCQQLFCNAREPDLNSPMGLTCITTD